VAGCVAEGLVLGARLPAMGTGRGSEKLGVCPRPRYLLAPFMLRLISKPVCDGASSGLGVLGVCYLLRRSWRRRKTALETDGVFGKHKRSSGLVCNFPLLRGLLCKMLWTAVLLCFSGRCLYGSRSVLFYYGIIQVLCYQKKSSPPAGAIEPLVRHLSACRVRVPGGPVRE